MKTFLCYAKCSTCAKAEKWLNANDVEFKKRDIAAANPSEKELRSWYKKSGLPLTRFFNTSGKKYRELDLKTKLKTMSEDEMLALLASDGMLVKRPILSEGKLVLVGFKEDEWKTKLLGE